MAYATRLTKSYILTQPKKYNNKKTKFDLDDRLRQMNFNEIMENSDSYFKNVKLTNFDLIHNKCSGRELSYSYTFCSYYQTLFKEKLDSEITDQKQKNSFISSAIKCHRDNVLIEKKIIDEHFIQKLEKENIFLSSMRRMKFKKTDDCKNLSY